MRRLFDLAVAGAGLALALPALAAIALAIRVTSTGPVLFRQERLGHHGEPFDILKFRTMVVTAPTAGPAVTSSDDRRITRVGSLLRSTKLDELPQLINVLRGEMGLVGPRPEVAHYAANWSDAQRRVILSVRPGITDPASVVFRREAEMLAGQVDPESYYLAEILPAKAAIYVDYVEKRSFAGDLRILVRTLRAVVSD